jgi:hypothetical protein
MFAARWLSLAAVVSLVACSSDPSTSPTTLRPTAPHLSAGTGAHFMNLSASLGNDGTLTVSFKEAGLGNTPVGGLVHIVLSAQASADYGCVNGGGNHPQATNKEAVAGPVSSAGDFPVGKNGAVVGTLSVSAPASTLDCPGGQREVLADVSFTGVDLFDSTNNDDAGLPGTFSRVFFTFK